MERYAGMRSGGTKALGLTEEEASHPPIPLGFPLSHRPSPPVSYLPGQEPKGGQQMFTEWKKTKKHWIWEEEGVGRGRCPGWD